MSFNALVANGVRDIILVVGYKKERIMSYFGDGSRFGANISYVVQDRQLGTAHALTFVKDLVDDRFLVLSGDNIIDKEMVSTLLSLGERQLGPGHREQRALQVWRGAAQGRSRGGASRRSPGTASATSSTPGCTVSNLTSSPSWRQGSRSGNYGITQVLSAHVPTCSLRAALAKGEWDDAVYPWDLVRLNEIALEIHGQAISGTIEPGVTIKGSVQIGKGTRVRSGTYIEGPVIIGEGCDIGPSSCIFPSTSIGDGVSIEPFWPSRTASS